MDKAAFIDKYSLYSQPRVYDNSLLNEVCCIKALSTDGYDDVTYYRSLQYLTHQLKNQKDLSVEVRIRSLYACVQFWKRSRETDYFEIFNFLLRSFDVNDYSKSTETCVAVLSAMLDTRLVHGDIFFLICSGIALHPRQLLTSPYKTCVLLSEFGKLRDIRLDLAQSEQLMNIVTCCIIPMLRELLLDHSNDQFRSEWIGMAIGGMASLHLIDINILNLAAEFIIQRPCGHIDATYLLVSIARADFHREDLVDHLVKCFFTDVAKSRQGNDKKTVFNLSNSLIAMASSKLENRSEIFLRCIDFVRQPSRNRHITVADVVCFLKALNRLRRNHSQSDPVTFSQLISATVTLFNFIKDKPARSHPVALALILMSQTLGINHVILGCYVSEINIDKLNDSSSYELASALVKFRIDEPKMMLLLLEKTAKAVVNKMRVHHVKRMYQQTLANIPDDLASRELVIRIDSLFLQNTSYNWHKTVRHPREFLTSNENKPRSFNNRSRIKNDKVKISHAGAARFASSYPIRRALQFFGKK